MEPSPHIIDTKYDPSALSDRDLVIQARQELPYNSRSFKELMLRYQSKVNAKAASMVENSEDAKDITQEVFLKIYNNLPKFQMKASFSTWVYIITVNTCLKHIEKRKRNPQWWMTDDISDLDVVQKEEEEIFFIMGKGVEVKDIGECIEATLDEMPERHQKVLALRFLDELDYQQMADKLELGLSALKMRLKRARERFREEFENQCMGSEE
ncbi:MAG: sigma-70 family RNA polymerase sigma factor [Candidatus Zixiibacteriota bacterium]